MLGSEVRTLAVGVLILLPFSCARPSSIKEHQRTRLDELQTRHWIHSERLRAVMAVLERETLTTWPQEVENEYAAREKTNQAFDEARSLADRLASSTPSISAAVTGTRMSEADRRAFEAQVDTLRDQAHRLHDATEARDLDRMRAGLQSIKATCRSCHDRFRDLAGSINSGKEQSIPIARR